MRIKKMRENAILPKAHNGNWLDTYVSQIGYAYREDDEEVSIKVAPFEFSDIEWTKGEYLSYAKGDIIALRLGFALELPKGKELHLLPRSGTFRKHGLILTNSMGIGDDTFIGDNDEYVAMFYAVLDGKVSIGDRLVQIKIVDTMKEEDYTFEEVESFGNEDRGGFGSTGK